MYVYCYWISKHFFYCDKTYVKILMRVYRSAKIKRKKKAACLNYYIDVMVYLIGILKVTLP